MERMELWFIITINKSMRKQDTPYDRIEYIKHMMDQIEPEIKHNAQSKIRGTTIETLCKFHTEGNKGPYQRIRDWCESKLKPASPPMRLSGEGLGLRTKFSGTKDEYETGATRDTREGKGRYDLISPLFLKRLAKVLEAGAKNHGDHNWKKGIPYSRLIDSSLRHISQFNEGMRDEDHLVQAVSNLMFLIHFEEEGRKDLNDLTNSLFI